MKRERLAWSEKALWQFDRLSDYLVCKIGIQRASDFVEGLIDRICVLEKSPLLGRTHPDTSLADRGYRVLYVDEYAAVYLSTEEGVWIAGVFHTKTDYMASLRLR